MSEDSHISHDLASGERPARLPADSWRVAETLIRSSEPADGSVAEDAFPREFYERFVPEHLVAVGGMGELRRYRDSALARDVVVKAIRGDQRDNEISRQRFLREARIQANLQHPCIVPVYDIGNLARKDVYFTMAHIGGVTLRDVIGGLGAKDPTFERRFSRRGLLEAFCRVCLAIAFAHEKGVIHRDLKPENIMLGEYGEVYVLDWGIARSDDRNERRSSGPVRRVEEQTPLPRLEYDEDEDVAELTEAGSTLGTLEYMAPEQYLSSSHPDERSDIYSLGAILYEILGYKPFRDGKDRGELVRLVWRETWKPMVRPTPEGVTPELDAVWRKATAAKRDARFQTARELHDALVGQLETDRAVQRRREEALSHAAAAALEMASLQTSPADAEERRGRALNSLGLALAADPSQAEGLGTLVQSLIDQPGDESPEVHANLRAVERKMLVRSAGLSAALYACWFLFLVIGQLWMGVLSHRTMGLMGAVVLGLIGYNYWVWRSEKPARGHMFAIMALSFGAVGVASSFLGPFMLVPSLATTMFAAFTISMRFDPRARQIAMGLSASAVLVPALLELTGALPPSYLFEDGKIVIVPRLVALPASITPAVLMASALLIVVLTNVLLAQAVGLLSASERSALTQALRLRQLLPASRSSNPPR